MAIYVSTKGNDDNSGTMDSPFSTLARAVEKSRERSAETKEIYIFGGEYENTSITLDERDCGLTIAPTNKSDPVILRGGIKAGGWQDVGGGLYCLKLPDFVAGDIRALEINGRFCLRSRFPQSGCIEHVTDCPLNWTSTLGGGWDALPTVGQLTELKYDPGALPSGFDWDNAEITVFHRWDESLAGVKSHDPIKNLLVLYPECGHPISGFGVKKYIVWNTAHDMAPGCWHFDKTARKIYYNALPGEDMQVAQTYIPMHDHIIKINGKISELAIRDIGFMTASAPMVPGGFGATNISGAIDGSHGLADSDFTGLSFENVGGWGIRLWGKNGGNKNVSICDCHVKSCGAGGILLADAGEGMKMHTAEKNGCVIYENMVEQIGLVYFSGIGIYASCCDVVANRLDDLPYTGIAYVGGNGGKITGNRVKNAVRTLNDGSGIYASLCEFGVISGNVVENIFKYEDGFSQRHALYLDEGCHGWRVEDNIVTNCDDAMMNHAAKENTIRNNDFSGREGGDDLLISFARCEGYVLEKNTFSSSQAITFAGRKGAIAIFKDNILRSKTNDVRQIYIDEKDYSRSPPTKIDGEIPLR